MVSRKQLYLMQVHFPCVHIFPAINTYEFVEQQIQNNYSKCNDIFVSEMEHRELINYPMMIMKLTFMLMASFLSSHIEAELQVGFYRDNCDFAEAIIRDEVERSFLINNGIAPGIVRLQFHDCFVRVTYLHYYALLAFPLISHMHTAYYSKYLIHVLS